MYDKVELVEQYFFFFFFTFCVKVLITLVTCARLLTAVYIVDNSPYLKHLVYLDV